MLDERKVLKSRGREFIPCWGVAGQRYCRVAQATEEAPVATPREWPYNHAEADLDSSTLSTDQSTLCVRSASSPDDRLENIEMYGMCSVGITQLSISALQTPSHRARHVPDASCLRQAESKAEALALPIASSLEFVCFREEVPCLWDVPTWPTCKVLEEPCCEVHVLSIRSRYRALAIRVCVRGELCLREVDAT